MSVAVVFFHLKISEKVGKFDKKALTYSHFIEFTIVLEMLISQYCVINIVMPHRTLHLCSSYASTWQVAFCKHP